jgi:hypothetical protein
MIRQCPGTDVPPNSRLKNKPSILSCAFFPSLLCILFLQPLQNQFFPIGNFRTDFQLYGFCRGWMLAFIPITATISNG